VAMYRFHRVGFAAARVADVPAQRTVRHARADESSRTQKTPTLEPKFILYQSDTLSSHAILLYI